MTSRGDGGRQALDPDSNEFDEDAAVESVERDGVASLHDVEAEAGDEEGLDDDFDIDVREAREAGAALDRVAAEEPRLD